MLRKIGFSCLPHSKNSLNINHSHSKITSLCVLLIGIASVVLGTLVLNSIPIGSMSRLEAMINLALGCSIVVSALVYLCRAKQNQNQSSNASERSTSPSPSGYKKDLIRDLKSNLKGLANTQDVGRTATPSTSQQPLPIETIHTERCVKLDSGKNWSYGQSTLATDSAQSYFVSRTNSKDHFSFVLSDDSSRDLRTFEASVFDAVDHESGNVKDALVSCIATLNGGVIIHKKKISSFEVVIKGSYSAFLLSSDLKLDQEVTFGSLSTQFVSIPAVKKDSYLVFGNFLSMGLNIEAINKAIHSLNPKNTQPGTIVDALLRAIPKSNLGKNASFNMAVLRISFDS